MTLKTRCYCTLKIRVSLVLICLIFAGGHGPAIAQDERPNVTEAIELRVYCPQAFDGQHNKIPQPKVWTSNREELACDTGGLSTTGGVRKNDNNYWIIELRRGEDIIEVKANSLGPPSRDEPGLKGQIFSVTDVNYGDWLRLRAAPAPFSEHISGIPRLQDNLRATGRVAQWRSSRWIEVEFIADLGWVMSTSIADTTARELIIANTTTFIGWVNARYVKRAETETPPEVETGAYFGSDTLEDSAIVDGQKKLRAVFGYRDSAGLYWRVPAGYVTDGASIPWLLWGVVGEPFDEDNVQAAIIHDYFCDVRRRTWRETHLVFYEALRASGVSDTKANAMYYAVQRFGPRWVEQRVQCLYVCAEQGEVTTYLKPKFDEGDWQEGLRKAQDSNVTLEELERLADQQLRDPDTIVRYELRTLSPIGVIKKQSHAHITIRELTQADVDPGDPEYGGKYLVVDQLLDRNLFDKVHKDRGERGVIGPKR